jgi:hypothetical protein
MCGRRDLNPHTLSGASPSSWCVCQFRHFRDEKLRQQHNKFTNRSLQSQERDIGRID